MNQTFQNSAQVFSIGIFFTLMIAGLASTLPTTMAAGLQAHGVDAATAHQAAALPPISILFSPASSSTPSRDVSPSSEIFRLLPFTTNASMYVAGAGDETFSDGSNFVTTPEATNQISPPGDSRQRST